MILLAIVSAVLGYGIAAIHYRRLRARKAPFNDAVLQKLATECVISWINVQEAERHHSAGYQADFYTLNELKTKHAIAALSMARVLGFRL